jgi:hypothetical protein
MGQQARSFLVRRIVYTLYESNASSDEPDCKGDREGRPYNDYEYMMPNRIFVGATLAVALAERIGL